MAETAQNMSTARYFKVSPLVLFPETLGRFSVYLRQAGGYVLYTSEEERFTDKHRRTLFENGVGEVFIRTEQRDNYERYMEDYLGQILQDSSIPMEERSRIFLGISASLAEEVYSEKLQGAVNAENVHRIEQIVRHCVDFLAVDGSLKSLGQFISHDYKTYTHCVHVFIYTTTILQAMSVEEEAVVRAGVGAMLHDIGKTKIPRTILNKPGRLTPEEREIINGHPIHGVSLCATAPLSQEAVNAILFHHERMDGKGYPGGLQGEEIPLHVRALTIADVYDAITSDRPYAKGMNAYQALKVMKEEMRGAFDLDTFKTFIMVLSGAALV